jgi:hypothetical protein
MCVERRRRQPRRLRVVDEGGEAFYPLIGPVLAVIPASGSDPRVYFLFNSEDVLLSLDIDWREPDCRLDSLSGPRRAVDPFVDVTAMGCWTSGIFP